MTEGNKGMSDDIDAEVLDRLYRVVVSRKGADPKTSHTARLFSKGVPRISQKVGEEAVETVIAANAEGREKVASESADLLYHLLVLWAASDIEPKEVWKILAMREGASGIAEKSRRPKD